MKKDMPQYHCGMSCIFFNWFRRDTATARRAILSGQRSLAEGYISGSMPSTGWPFSVSQFSSSSQSVVTVSSAIMSVKLSMP